MITVLLLFTRSGLSFIWTGRLFIGCAACGIGFIFRDSACDFSRFGGTVCIIPLNKLRRVQDHFTGVVRPVVRVLAFVVGVDRFSRADTNAAGHVHQQRQQQKGGRKPLARIKLLHVPFPPFHIPVHFSFSLSSEAARKDPVR